MLKPHTTGTAGTKPPTALLLLASGVLSCLLQTRLQRTAGTTLLTGEDPDDAVTQADLASCAGTDPRAEILTVPARFPPFSPVPHRFPARVPSPNSRRGRRVSAARPSFVVCNFLAPVDSVDGEAVLTR